MFFALSSKRALVSKLTRCCWARLEFHWCFELLHATCDAVYRPSPVAHPTLSFSWSCSQCLANDRPSTSPEFGFGCFKSLLSRSIFRFVGALQHRWANSGDLIAQRLMLRLFMAVIAVPKEKNYIFMGDFVDRGWL